MPDASELKRWLTTANAIADETRALILKTVREGFDHRMKEDDTFVTDVDLAVEKLFRRRLEKRFPEHGLIGEEYAHERTEARLRWTIDPIDGTHSFRHGLQLYGTILALLDGEKPILGVIDLPGLEVRLSAATGLGATMNGAPLRLDDCEETDIEKELIAAGERSQFVTAGREAVFDHLMTAHRHVRTYCDAFGHMLALSGRVGAMVDFGLHIWDVAATEILIQEAGGAFKTLFHGPRANNVTSYDVVFGKPSVVDWLLARIKEAEA